MSSPSSSSSSPPTVISLLTSLPSSLPKTSSNLKQIFLTKLEELQQLVDHESGMGENELDLGWMMVMRLGERVAPTYLVKLINHLRPRSTIPGDVVLRILGHLGPAWNDRPKKHGRVDYRVQQRGLRWLIQVNAWFSPEARDMADRFYGVIMHYLDCASLRTDACHLLFLITRRSHVQRHRVSKLLKLRDVLPNAPEISTLLRLYREFYPSLIVVTQSRRLKRHTFKYPDPDWRRKTFDLRNGLESTQDSIPGHDRPFKRRKASGKAPPTSIPTAMGKVNANESSFTIPDIRSLEELAAKLERVEMPSQAASILAGLTNGLDGEVASDRARFGAWTLVTRSFTQKSTLVRLSMWLVGALDAELYDVDRTPTVIARVTDLFRGAIELSRLGGEILPDLEEFLAEFLNEWDGDCWKGEVFGLLELVRPKSYEVMHGWFLKPLERLAATASAEWTEELLVSLSRLVMNWATRGDWRSGGFDDDEGDETRRMPFGGDLDPNVNVERALEEVTREIERIIRHSLKIHPSSLSLRTVCMNIYSLFTDLSLEHSIPIILIPTLGVAYRPIISSDPGQLSSMCRTFSLITQALNMDPRRTGTTNLKKTPTSTWKNYYPRDLVHRFNVVILDYINFLWRDRGLVREKEVGLDLDLVCGLKVEESDKIERMTLERNQDVKSSFALTQSGAFVGLATVFLRDLEVTNGRIPQNLPDSESESLFLPLNAKQLKSFRAAGGIKISYRDFRREFLEYLRVNFHGEDGIYNFLSCVLAGFEKKK